MYNEFEGNESAVAAAIYAGEEYGRQMHKGKYLFDPNTRINEEGNLSANGKYPSVNEYVEQVLGRKVQGKAAEPPRFEPVEPKEIEFAKEPQQNLNPINWDKVTPEELSNHVENGNIKPIERMLDDAEYQHLKKLPREEQVKYAMDNLAKLREGVLDPMGETVKFIVDDGSMSAFIEGTERMITGHNKGDMATISTRRVITTKLIHDTVTNPDLILKSKATATTPSRKLYTSFWQGEKGMLHKVVVSLGERGDKGKIITQMIVADEGGKILEG